MLTIEEINLLVAQNKELKEQNIQLQQACKKYEQALNNINDLVSKWYENEVIQYQGDYDEFLAIINKAKEGNDE